MWVGRGRKEIRRSLPENVRPKTAPVSVFQMVVEVECPREEGGCRAQGDVASKWESSRR